MFPSKRKYSTKTIVVTLLLCISSYSALAAAAFFWAWPLGDSNADVQRSFDSYAERDASFNLAYYILAPSRNSESCGWSCQILRQYTEIRDAQARIDLKLVDPLVRSSDKLPNIFIFVIDSMRPDYIGAYNPKADFTPTIDALARDGVALKNVYTQYAGTSLSEPAIWAGAYLLHAHFMQPFEHVNSLEKLARVDGYQMFVSVDDILREILSPASDLVELDTNKGLWNQLEICSTVEQAEVVLDHRSDSERPIFFYTQPKNVHRLGKSNLPKSRSFKWPVHPGFDNRISFEMHRVDACLGGFIAWLKAHGLYDDSILIVTSDHGDATGEFGRVGHSLVLYPEIMRVPLIVHLPKIMQNKYVYDDARISALTDVTPSLYYLLGHRPVVSNPMFGHPLFAVTQDELHSYHRDELFMASDARAAYGVLADHGRYFYATYDSPAQSYLYDLVQDPDGRQNILTGPLKTHYDERVIAHLQEISKFYGYGPGVDPKPALAK
jgi:membrane-anchored protein YejM (alkaline phosphatase superfamily)